MTDHIENAPEETNQNTSEQDPVKALIIRTAGTNCELELAHAFELAGATTELIHLKKLMESPDLLLNYKLIGLPGGFSYGDDIAAGTIFAHHIKQKLLPSFQKAIENGTLIIGICNGFQILVKCGLLPAVTESEDQNTSQQAVLGENTVGHFIDQWEALNLPESRCIWTKGLSESPMELPIAHGEGRFAADESLLNQLESQNQIALTYENAPNGSSRQIAGVTDETGQILGLMPHPERAILKTHHPRWTREAFDPEQGGLALFRNAVNHLTN